MLDWKNFAEMWIVRLWCAGKCLTADCFTLSNIGVGNVFKTTTTSYATFWASIVHRSYVQRSCAHRSHVHCPALKTVSCIEDSVLHWIQCPALKTVSWKNYLWSASPPAANTSWRGAHSLPKPLSDIFETFWISASQYVRNVQNSTNMPYKDLTRYKIFLAVSKYILWDSLSCPKTRLAGLQMVFIQSKPVWEETIRESLASGGKVGGLPWNDSMFKYWLWYPSPPLLPLSRHINIQNFEKNIKFTPHQNALLTLYMCCAYKPKIGLKKVLFCNGCILSYLHIA